MKTNSSRKVTPSRKINPNRLSACIKSKEYESFIEGFKINRSTDPLNTAITTITLYFMNGAENTFDINDVEIFYI